MIRFMHLTTSYHCSKGSLERIVEDGALGNLAPRAPRGECFAPELSGFIPYDSGSLQSIPGDPLVSPKAPCVNFTSIIFS